MKCRFITANFIVSFAAGLLCAILVSSPQQGGADRASRIREAASKPTPRASDGHPDLTGFWGEPQRFVSVELSADGKTRIAVDRDAPELDTGDHVRFMARAADRTLKPPYKPQCALHDTPKTARSVPRCSDTHGHPLVSVMLLETRREMVHEAFAVAIRADDVRYIQQRFVPGDQRESRLVST